MGTDRETSFDAFVRSNQEALWQAVASAAGPDAASDAVSIAWMHAWRTWDRVAEMENPMGYLYTIASREARRRPIQHGLPIPAVGEVPGFEPRLVPALGELTEMQRRVVYLVDGFGWGLTDAARILDISVSTVRNHRSRALSRLRDILGVESDA